MKKEINKVILTLGFIVSLLGLLIDSIIVESAMFAMLGTPIFLGAFSFCFVYANNATLNRFGYVFAAIAGVDSIAAIIFSNTDAIVAYIGFIIMFVAAVVYFICKILSFFGYKKCDADNNSCEAIAEPYDQMLEYQKFMADGIINEQEFASLKSKLLGVSTSKVIAGDFEQLKKWKKLVEQNVITEEEFAGIKSKILKK